MFVDLNLVKKFDLFNILVYKMDAIITGPLFILNLNYIPSGLGVETCISLPSKAVVWGDGGLSKAGNYRKEVPKTFP